MIHALTRMDFIDTNSTKSQRTVRRRRKTAPTPFDEAIGKYVDEALAGNKGSAQEVFASAVQNFFKRLLEAMLRGEMDAHLKGITPLINDNNDVKDGDFDAPVAETAWKRNCFSEKTLKTASGPMMLNIPRDRNGTFEPLVVPKHSRSFGRLDE